MKTWEDGVKDSISCIEFRIKSLKAFNTDVMRISQDTVNALEDALVFLKALLERGGKSTSQIE